MTLKLKIITGSTRPGRVGPTISKWVEKAAVEHRKFDVEVVDLAHLGLPLLDEASHPMAQKYAHQHTVRWSKIVEDADAFVFVTPEYDYFTPAALVNAVQVLLREWGYNPTGTGAFLVVVATRFIF